MKILIRNLDRETTQQELQTAFETHGKVQSSDIVKGWRSKSRSKKS
jgi:RNA recognition motif-containing protein